VVALASKAKAWLAARLLAQVHQGFSARTRRSAEQFLNSHCPDAIVLGHSLEQKDREVLVAKARLIPPDADILVLHASGADLPVVPHAAIDSREGSISVLLALEELLDDSRQKKPPAKQAAGQKLSRKQYRTQS
jgi:hypothetical protein